jgi:hypothetical protein
MTDILINVFLASVVIAFSPVLLIVIIGLTVWILSVIFGTNHRRKYESKNE